MSGLLSFRRVFYERAGTVYVGRVYSTQYSHVLLILTLLIFISHP